jgi:hypothetical protein
MKAGKRADDPDARAVSLGISSGCVQNIKHGCVMR